jgi:argininosuccinate synthase
MKIVLAYSGGLDTSVALHWLRSRYEAEVIAFCADIGQLESLDDVRVRAQRTGASEVRIESLIEPFLDEFALPALKGHARYEDKYLLAAPLSRPLIARRMVEIAHETGATAIAHGATGKGNDQVRFHASVTALDPDLRILTPVIDWELKHRADEFDYAKANDIPVALDRDNPYSIDTNIWGTSIECGELDDVTAPPPESAWQLTKSAFDARAEPEQICIEFEQGTPVALDGRRLPLPQIVQRLNAAGAQHGVGRIDIIESRLSGFKTRGIYEAPAATILMCAHAELEALVLDRDTLHHKQSIGPRYGELVYYGYWFSDLRRAFDGFVRELQHRVTGEVNLELYKRVCAVAGRRSAFARYRRELATYEAGDTFDHRAGSGFAYIWSLPLAEQHDSGSPMEG